MNNIAKISRIFVCALLSFSMLFTAGCSKTKKAEFSNPNTRNYYEIFVGSFYDSDGNGIGDLRGIIGKLDYIADMGFNGIWLTPIMPSTTYHKYDVIDYCNVDEELGNLDDFDKLVSECHKRDIKLIIDMVVNHSSAQNEWFLKAADYLRSLPEGASLDVSECQYVDYYHFSKDYPGNGWCKLEGSEYFYECQFWDQMPDLNLSNPQLFEELQGIFDFWLERGVDGFRMDAPLHYEDGNDSFNIETLSKIYEYCKTKNPEFYMVSEVWASDQTIAEYYKSLTPSFFNFDAAQAEGSLLMAAHKGITAEKLVNNMLKWQEEFSANNPDYIDAPFLTNHDMVRASNALVSKENNLKFAGGLLSIMSGNTFVYYGEEVGMKSKGSEDENKRLPMHWSDTDTTGIPKPYENAAKDVKHSFPAVDEQLSDETSILNYYKKAFNLRLQNPEIAEGKVEIVSDLTVEHQAVIKKVTKDSYIYLAINTSDEEITVDMSGLEMEGRIVGYLAADGSEREFEKGILKLRPKSIVYFK